MTGLPLPKMSALRGTVRVYADRRMLIIAALGFSSGLPLALVGSTLSLWLFEAGETLASVGLFAAVGTPYKLKFLWAPLIDRVRLPFFGLRRGWLIITQVALAACLLGLANADPGYDLVLTAMWAVATAFCAASQDVVVDGYRVELLEDDAQGAGAAAVVFGYRIGMIASGAGALYLATYFGWGAAYVVMALGMSVGMVATLFAAEPEGSEERTKRLPDESRGEFINRQFVEGVIGPFRDLFSRKGVWVFLGFIMLYKLGDSLAASMLTVFQKDLGFSKIEIANISKTYGIIASIVGVGVGGALVRGVGVIRALWIAGWVQLVSNFAFCVQAVVGYDVITLICTVGFENFTGGLGTAAFVAYLSALSDRAHSATQYALLTALAGTVRMLLSMVSGVAAEWLGWTLYFAVTAVAALPGLLVLRYIQRSGITGLVRGK